MLPINTSSNGFCWLECLGGAITTNNIRQGTLHELITLCVALELSVVPDRVE